MIGVLQSNMARIDCILFSLASLVKPVHLIELLSGRNEEKIKPCKREEFKCILSNDAVFKTIDRDLSKLLRSGSEFLIVSLEKKFFSQCKKMISCSDYKEFSIAKLFRAQFLFTCSLFEFMRRGRIALLD